MKKRILTLIVLALTFVSVFAFASCGKEKTVACPNCEGNLYVDEIEDMYQCDLGKNHSFDICINERCKAPIDNSPANKKGEANHCSACGISQEVCHVCEDPENVDGAYCYACGKKVVRDASVELGFDVNALGQSAMILLKGMIGIFIVTGIIITFILVLNRVVEKANKTKEDK